MLEEKITTCKLIYSNNRVGIIVEYDDKYPELLASFRPGELQFEPSEVIGLTKHQARDVIRSRELSSKT